MSVRGVLASTASLLIVGCLRPNPEFDGGQGSGASDFAGGSAGPGSTTGAGASTDGSAGAGASSGSGGGSTGGVGPSDTTGTTSTAGEASTTGEVTMTGGSTSDAPKPEQVVLQHYTDLAQCDYPHWCVSNGDINDPVTGEHWDGECFDSPLAPPFTVDRVGLRIFGVHNAPSVSLEFHEYDEGAAAPVAQPFAVVPLGAIAQAGYLEFPIAPVPVPVQRFCIVIHSGMEGQSQLGVAVDDVPAPVGQSFIGLDGPMNCNLAKFADMAELMLANPNQWCIDATITKL